MDDKKLEALARSEIYALNGNRKLKLGISWDEFEHPRHFFTNWQKIQIYKAIAVPVKAMNLLVRKNLRESSMKMSFICH